MGDKPSLVPGSNLGLSIIKSEKAGNVKIKSALIAFCLYFCPPKYVKGPKNTARDLI